MHEYYFTFRSITTAQRGAAVCSRVGIASRLQRTPSQMARQGCGYSLRIRPENAAVVARLLQAEQIDFQRVYYYDGKTPAEVQL